MLNEPVFLKFKASDIYFKSQPALLYLFAVDFPTGYLCTIKGGLCDKVFKVAARQCQDSSSLPLRF